MKIIPFQRLCQILLRLVATRGVMRDIVGERVLPMSQNLHYFCKYQKYFVSLSAKRVGTMRRLFVVIACLALWAEAANAQYKIEDIRQSYANVKEHIGRMSGEFPAEGTPEEYYHLHVEQNLPGTGGHHEHLRMYYGELEGDVIYPPHYLWFATRKYNFAVREYYEEYLYDNKGQIMFIYATNPDVVFGEMYEFRLYYDGQRLLKCIVKQRKVDEKNYREVYNGPAIPEAYTETTDMLRGTANVNLRLFKQIDDVAYPYSESNSGE